MKKTMLYIGSVIILILSAICFIFIPAMSQGAAENYLVFGKYGNKKIEYKPGTEFANAVNNYTEMYRNQGAELKDNDYFYIYNYAFVSAVQAVAYSEAVKKAGFTPAKEAVARAMLPYFSDENGNYSKKLFESVGEEEKANLKTELTKGLVWNRYSEDLLGSQSQVSDYTMFGLKTAKAETELLEEMASTKRTFDMAVFNKADYPDSAVKTFGGENKDKFTKYNLSVITVKDASKAKSVLNQISKEEITFADAVSEYSDKAYSGSDGLITQNLGYQIKNIIAKEADAEKVLALAADEISDVVETTTGYSIFRCNLAKTEADFSDKATLSAVRSYIEDNEASRIEDYYITSAKGMTANADTKSFEKACSESEGKFVSIPAMTLNYNNSSLFDSISVSELPGASTNENFLEKAFSLKNGGISEPIVIDDKIVVLKLTAESKEPLTEEKAKSLKDEVKNLDSSASQSTLLTSSKVQNDVASVFFEKIMKNN